MRLLSPRETLAPSCTGVGVASVPRGAGSEARVGVAILIDFPAPILNTPLILGRGWALLYGTSRKTKQGKGSLLVLNNAPSQAGATRLLFVDHGGTALFWTEWRVGQ